MVTRIGHVALHVRDIDRSIAFFEAVLGLRMTLRDGDRVATPVAGAEGRVRTLWLLDEAAASKLAT